MSILDERPALRWTAPVAAVALVAGGSFVAGRSASADPNLPPVSAEQLLVDVQKARVEGLSGTVVQTSDLGLPEIPGMGGGASGSSSGSSSLTSMVSGTHMWRVWYGGVSRQRLALVGSLGESDVIRNGPDVWVWSSQDKTAEHRVLPKDAGSTNPPPMPSDLPATPEAAAARALALVGPTTTVSTTGSATVAGRPAYELVLAPKESGSLVERVRIAVDASTHVPLRVQVFSTRLTTPAFEVGFSSVDFTMPDAGRFDFNPPPGTKVTEGGPLTTGARGPARDGDGSKGGPAGAARRTGAEPTVVGSGWSSVVVTRVPGLTSAGPARSGSDQGTAQLAQALRALPKVSGDWGSGRLLNGTLFSAVITDDGRVAVGAVRPDSLYAALAK